MLLGSTTAINMDHFSPPEDLFMRAFIEKFKSAIKGTLSGWDRIRIQGTLRYLMQGGGVIDCMQRQDKCSLGNYPEWVKEKSDGLLKAARAVIENAGRSVQYLQDPRLSKEELARAIMERDRIGSGTICGFTALEPARVCECRSNKGRPFLNYRYGKCLHLYHYQIHPVFGFMHIRLQTWLPFNVTLCINGREWLRQELDHRRMRYEKVENCFLHVADFEKVQQIMATQLEINWAKVLNPLVGFTNPGLATLFSRTPMDYYWSFQSSEWATDVVFKDEALVQNFLVPSFIDQAIKVFDCTDAARFLGEKITASGNLHGASRSKVRIRYRKRKEGACVKFCVNSNSLKTYIKHGTEKGRVALRVETTINNPSKYKCPRKVTKGKRTSCVRKRMRKGVADSYQRATLSQATNLHFLDALAEHVKQTTPFDALICGVTKQATLGKTSFRALRPFEKQDYALLQAVANGTYMLQPFRNADIRQTLLGDLPASDMERRHQGRSITQKLRMLRAHGIIAKVPHSRSYNLTLFGQRLFTAVKAARCANTEQLLKLAA